MTPLHEYLEQATWYLTNPRQAEAIRMEMRAHLEDLAEELQGEGLNADTALATAVARMGPPQSIALDLAEAHHRPLPWRHYLAPVFLGCITFCLWTGEPWQVTARWFPFLIFSVWPDRRDWGGPMRLLRVDLRVKWRWLRRQPWDRGLITGGASGAVAGLIWSAVPHWFEPVNDYMVIFPLSAALLMAAVQRRLMPTPALLTASGAAFTFPFAFLLGFSEWWPPTTDWPSMTAFFTICFGLAALGAGWLTEVAQAKGWTLKALKGISSD